MPSLTTFASRTPASYIAGEVFTDEVRTSAEMLKRANLAGWDVRLRPLPSDARYTKETFEVVRTNPFDGELDRLGVSGERYFPIQNETVFGLFDHLEPQWEAAGSFKNGAVVYGQVDSERTIVLDPEGAADEIHPSISVATSHDGSGALKIGRTAMRLDCYNQFALMFGNLTHSITVRHTKTADERMKAIARAWKGNNAYFDRLDAEAQALFAQSVTDNQFFGIVGQFMGDRPEENVKGSQTKYDTALDLYTEAYRGETNEKAHGTAWGVFNALIEKNQWARTIQSTPSGVENFAMAGMGFDIPTNTFRQRAYEAARSLVTA